MITKSLRHTATLALIASLAFGVTACGGTAELVQLEGCDENRLQGAADHYNFELLEETIRQLQPCMPTGFGDTERNTRAHRLVALSYYYLDEPDSSEQSIKSLLKLDERYRADPATDPLFFQVLVDRWRPKSLAEKLFEKRWFRIGAGVAYLSAIGFIAASIFSTSGSSELPGPNIPLPSRP